MIVRHFVFTRILNSLSRQFYCKVIDTYRVKRVVCQSSHLEKCFVSMQYASEKSSEHESSVALPKQQTARGAETQQVNTNKGGKKVKQTKKDPKKNKKKKKRQDAECTESLMSELPFTNIKIWKDLDFTSTESSVKKKRKRGESGRVESEEDGDKKKQKKETSRPNYFVSVPITNLKIKQAVKDVQKLVLEKDSRLSRALIPVDTLHITLLVTHLNTQEQVEVAVSALSELEKPLNALLGGRSFILPFCGVGHFKQEVAFIQIAEGDHLSTLTQMAECVRKTFEEKGIASADDKAFKPHLTFLKLSRAPKLRKQGVKKLDPALFSEFESRVFGDECVCRVDLCSMLKKKTADGYYHCEKSVTFTLLQSRQHAVRASMLHCVKKAPPPDDDELVSLSKRLVEDAVLRAVQQYMEETQQNGTPPKDEGPPGRADKQNSTK
ncbi:A-kinase anchor protein 7-like isoform X2 [Misgurnus anguillicaudatus]|uniref:A-kinase anchor protein 7-like isoform X2 n=1 Tax=Misgurnus anguillicaudatus TaxID=75329 RepID=UPI003CCF491E